MWSRVRDGWRGVALVGITYVYFLIFAQFAFLSRIGEFGIEGAALKVVMGAMAMGGIVMSLLTPRVLSGIASATRLRFAFAASGIAAVLCLVPMNVFGAAGVACLIGAGLGLLTVTLVSDLRRWTGERHGVLKVGVGTGLGYLICNVPAVFTAGPEMQAVLAAGLCAAGIAVTIRAHGGAGTEALPSRAPFGTTEVVPFRDPVQSDEFIERQAFEPGHFATFYDSEFESDAERGSSQGGTRVTFARALAAFAALVWLDSAAFYIIQHVPALKAGTWMGSAHLWMNAGLHLLAAIASGLLLERRRINLVLCGAFAALAFACVLLNHAGLVLSASLFYPLGVSLYSVALVAYPSFLTSARSDAERGRQAGWLYAAAGWIGSALGIGMGQNLGHVPLAFVAGAGAVVLVPAVPGLLESRGREVAVMVAAAVGALGLWRALPAASHRDLETDVERGRQVYISEGCIHCHSQYVRPHSPDVLMWGPTETLEEIHAQKPPLIGNRRQGPDLAEVGARRSPLWLKAHLIDPAEVSGGSIMPSFAMLFRDQRGDDLVAYLASLHGADVEKHIDAEHAWNLPQAAIEHADVNEGPALYQRFCATCHDANGATRRRWQSSFDQLPTDLFRGPYRYLRGSDAPDARVERLVRITKFGIPGTDMPGHEYLSDQQIASLSVWLAEKSAQIHHP